MEENENRNTGNVNQREYLKSIEFTTMICSSKTISNLSLISSNDPFISSIITLYILILLYFPQSFFSLKLLLIFTASLLFSLFRKPIDEVKKTEFQQRVGSKTDSEFIIRSFEELFVESDVGAPLEVIFEGEEEEEEKEGEYCNEDYYYPDPTRVIERYPSLSLCYPESDSDSSSSEMDFPVIGEWVSSEMMCYGWEEEEDKEGMIEIDLDFHEEEDNLIEIDIS
ncbi:hypothetical protein GOBAR_AA06762 [Gossypium barbadense]|nr:hypothetical protein GOBAR_AA06762 [Gossypium barbadense]